MMFPMKFFSLSVLAVANVITPFVVVDAFTGVVKKRTWTRTQAQQPSQQPSFSRLSYLIREGGDDVGTCTGTTSIIPTMYTTRSNTRSTVTTVAPIASPTGTIVSPTPSPVRDPDPTTITGTINLNNYVDEQMIEDLQNQHQQFQMMQLQQQQQVTTSSSSSVGIVDNTYHDDDLTELNRHLLRSKVAFIRRLLPPNKKQYMEQFVNLMIKLSSSTAIATTTTRSSSTIRMSMSMSGNDHRNRVASRGGVNTYGKVYDDLTYLNIQLLRSKVAFLHRLFPTNKKHHMERFVNFLIQCIL